MKKDFNNQQINQFVIHKSKFMLTCFGYSVTDFIFMYEL